MISILASAPQDLQLFKISMLDATGLGKDALHIYGGLGLFLTIRLLWRWRGGWLLAWLAVLALACAIEWLDMQVEIGSGWPRPDAEHWHDIWNTMFWPTVLLLVGRWLQPRPKHKVSPQSEAILSDCADEPFEQPPSV